MRYLEQPFMFPFILIGRLIALLKPIDRDFDIFLFYPLNDIGGAERVNAEVLNAVSDKKACVVFTKKSRNHGMLHFYEKENATIIDISKWTDNKSIYFINFIFRGIYAAHISSQNKTQVFIGQCNFGYKLTPHIPREILVTELIHVDDPKFLWVWAPFVQFIHKRVLIEDVFIETFKKVYDQYGIPSKYTERFHVIRYCLEFIPQNLTIKKFVLPFKVYYAGRGGPQKRLWILFRIIEACRNKELPIEFKLAGSFANELPEELQDDGTYIGELKGGEAMYNFHKSNDILLMTSAFEGFPLVIMEALAFGTIVIAPNVDAIPENIKDGKNGFLLNEIEDEDALVTEAIEKIEFLIKNRSTLPNISRSGYELIQERFTKEVFINSYRKLFEFE